MSTRRTLTHLRSLRCSSTLRLVPALSMLLALALPVRVHASPGGEVKDSVYQPHTGQWRITTLPAVDPPTAPDLRAAGGGNRPVASWVQLAGPNSGKIQALAVTSAGHIFAGTVNSGVFRSSDGGQTWPRLTNGFPSNGSVNALHVCANGTILMGANSGLYRSTDNGASWQQVLSSLVNAFSEAAGGIIYAGSYLSGVLRSANNGVSWTSVNSGLGATDVRSVHATAAGTIYAGTGPTSGAGQGMFTSPNGYAWSAAGLQGKPALAAICEGSTGQVFVSTAILPGYGQGVFLTTNGGGTWLDRSTGLTTSDAMRAINRDHAGQLLVGTWSGLFRSTNAGVTWQADGISDVVNAIVRGTSQATYVGGTFGYVHRSGTSSTIGPRITLDRTVLDYGSVQIGGNGVQGFIVTNTGDTRMSIRSYRLSSVTSEFVSLTSPPTFLDPGQSFTWSWRFTALSAGFKSVTLTIETDDPTVAQSVVTLQGTGVQVTRPAISVSTTSLSFGTLRVGQQSEQTLIVQNTGNDVLSILGLWLQGPAAPQYAATNLGGSSLSPFGATTIRIRYTPTAPGTHVATCSIYSNDPVTGTVVISITGTAILQAIKPHVSAMGPTDICSGESVLLTAESGFASYRWSTGATTQSITVTTSGTYTVEVTDNLGATGTSDPLTVTVHPLPAPLITYTGSRQFCVGDSLVLDAGAGYARYLWTRGDTTRTITVRQTGSYGVSVLSTLGCYGSSAPVSVQVTTIQRPVLAAPAGTVTCQGGTLPLSAPSGYSTYQWSSGEQTSSIQVTRPGLYYVRVTNGSGCSAVSDSVRIDITNPPTPVITYVGSTDFCEGDSIVLDAGAGYAQYHWSTGDTTRRLTVRSSGGYAVTVRTAAGCQGSSQAVQVEVSKAARPKLFVSGSTIVCEGGSVTLDGGSGYAMYEWSSGERTVSLTVTRPGSYFLTAWTFGGCRVRSDTVTVTFVPAPPAPTIARVGDLLTCTRASSYQWYWENIRLVGDTNQFCRATRNGTYYVKITNEYGCSAVSNPTSIVLAVEKIPAPLNIAVYPQPASGAVWMRLELERYAIVQYSIVSIDGRRIRAASQALSSGSHDIKILEPPIPAGVYYLTVQTGGRSRVYPIVMQ